MESLFFFLIEDKSTSGECGTAYSISELMIEKKRICIFISLVIDLKSFRDQMSYPKIR